jgi:hypothetical protein
MKLGEPRETRLMTETSRQSSVLVGANSKDEIIRLNSVPKRIQPTQRKLTDLFSEWTFPVHCCGGPRHVMAMRGLDGRAACSSETINTQQSSRGIERSRQLGRIPFDVIQVRQWQRAFQRR